MKGLLIFSIVIAMTIMVESAINPVGCGLRPLKPKVVGGVEAIEGDWGWMTLMKRNNQFLCGASVINSRWIVSAAHCTTNLNVLTYKLEVGGHHRNNITNEPWVQIMDIEKIINHPQYSASTYNNDIVLLKTTKPIIFDDQYIIPVCIPDGTEDFVGQTGYATGWGAISSGGSTSLFNKEVGMILLSDTRCKAKYPTANVTTMICGADNHGVDTCQGDSGGPYTFYSNKHNGEVLKGITSWGYGCGGGGVYTRTSNYYQWIINTILANP